MPHKKRDNTCEKSDGTVLFWMLLIWKFIPSLTHHKANAIMLDKHVFMPIITPVLYSITINQTDAHNTQ